MKTVVCTTLRAMHPMTCQYCHVLVFWSDEYRFNWKVFIGVFLKNKTTQKAASMHFPDYISFSLSRDRFFWEVPSPNYFPW